MTPLRKDKYSINYLVSLEIQDILPLWFDLRNRSLLETASYWFDNILDEIETEAKKPLIIEGKEHERSLDYIQDKTRELELKHFGISLDIYFERKRLRELKNDK